MPTCNMTGFVGQNAHKFVNIVRGKDKARMEKDILAAGNKGVDRLISKQIHMNRLWRQASRLINRRGNLTKKSFSFRVSED